MKSVLGALLLLVPTHGADNPLTAAFAGTLQVGDGTYYGNYVSGGKCMLDPDPATRNGVLSVALNAPQYGDSIGCGMCLEVRGNGQGSGATPVPSTWTPAFVNNVCPECVTGSLDLASSGDGRWHIEWRPVICPDAGPIQILQKSGSSIWHIELQIRNHRVPITGVALKVNNVWKPLVRQPYNYWKNDGSIAYPISYPMAVQITGINGCVITDVIPADKADVIQTGTTQFTADCSASAPPAGVPTPAPSPATVPPPAPPTPPSTPPPTATCTPVMPNCAGSGITIAKNAGSNVNWVQIEAEPNVNVNAVFAIINGVEQQLKRESYGHFTTSVPGNGVIGTVVVRAVKLDGSCVGALLVWDSSPTPCPSSPASPPPTSPSPAPSTFVADYALALTKSYKFYHAQRGGLAPADVDWRGTCFADDGKDVGLDLSGGWFDAGDYVKFGVPMAYSAACLAWGVLEFPDGYRASALSMALSELRFVAQYFLNGWNPTTKQLVAQVGDGNTDHGSWAPCKTRKDVRPTALISPTCGGTEVAGETAAALASIALVFRTLGQTADQAFADQCATAAAEIYSFAETYQKKYTDCVPNAKAFYESWSGFNDELAWGAAWLAKLTGSADYLAKAKQRIGAVDPLRTISWDDVTPGAALLLWELTNDDTYAAQLRTNFDTWMRGAQTLDQWGVLRYKANSAFLALVYGKRAKSDAHRNLGRSLINEILGDNSAKRSYVVGVGPNYPINPHHRSAHDSPNADINTPVNNAHLLEGALVGGGATYADSRQDYVTNEVTTDYNALFSGALAAMVELSTTTSPPPPSPAPPAPTPSPVTVPVPPTPPTPPTPAPVPVPPTPPPPAAPVNPCDPNPCIHGLCSVVNNAASCLCESLWTGNLCDVPYCQCTGNFVCVKDTCVCAPGWEGTTCERRITFCSPNPCQNGGVCRDGATSAECVCPAQFSGASCETQVATDFCASNPCLNGGRCVNDATSFKCDCAAGFTGEKCATNVDPCASNPCSNNGVCSTGALGTYTCQCPAGFLGATCKDTDPCFPNPCQNGGVCSIASGYLSCGCGSGFLGARCENTVPPSTTCAAALAVNPWKLNVVATGSIGTDNRPYQSDFQGPMAAVKDIFVTGFDTNLVATSSRSGKVPYAVFAGENVKYLGGNVNNAGIAAGGDVTLQGVTVRGDIVAGGSLICTTGGTVTGAVSLGGGNKAAAGLSIAGAVKAAQTVSHPLDLQQLSSYFKALSTQAGLRAADLKYTNNWDAISITTTDGLHFVEITEAELKQAHSITVNGPATAVVVINVHGEDAALDSLTWKWQNGITSDRVIVNFPQAKSLALSGGDHRTVILAPFADVTFEQGLVTGHLIAGNLVGGGQVNDDFQFSGEALIKSLADPCFKPRTDICTSNPCANGGTCVPTLGGYSCQCPKGFVGMRCDVSTAVTFTAKPRDGSNPYWVSVDVEPASKVEAAKLVQGSLEYKLQKQHWDVPVFTLNPDQPLKDGDAVFIHVTDIYGQQTAVPLTWVGGSKCGDKTCAVNEFNADCPTDCPLKDTLITTAASRVVVKDYQPDKFAQALADALPSVNAYQVSSKAVTSTGTASKMRTAQTTNAQGPTTVEYTIANVNANHAPQLSATATSMLQKSEGLTNTLGVVQSGSSSPSAAGAAPDSGSKAWIAGVVVPVVVVLCVAAVVGVILYRKKQAATSASSSTVNASLDPSAPTADYAQMDKQL